MRERHPSRFPETIQILKYLSSQGFVPTGQLAYQRGDIGVWTKRMFYKIKFGVQEFSYNSFKNFFEDLVYLLEIRPTFDPSVIAAYAKYIDANYLNWYRDKMPGFQGSLKIPWGAFAPLDSTLDFDFGNVLQVADSPHIIYQSASTTFGPMSVLQLYASLRIFARIGYDSRYASGVTYGFWPGWHEIDANVVKDEGEKWASIQGSAYRWDYVSLGYSFIPKWDGLRSIIGLAESQNIKIIPGYNADDAKSALAFIDAHENFQQEIDFMKKSLVQKTQKEIGQIRADFTARYQSEKLAMQNFAQQQLFAVRTNKESVLRDLQLMIVTAQGAMRGR